ncbi:MAG: hypothetical protein K0Q72_2123 [Armatimonadetes bacterium]|jgi:hypothetical protein|nr:hypothetical protein [Armatimonadota bacterium]
MGSQAPAKRRGQLPDSTRLGIVGGMVAVFLGTAALSEGLRPGHMEYLRAASAVDPGDVRAMEARQYLKDTSFEALVPTLLGVREVLASLMWVQADDYFHRGEYRPIIRMVKQITTMDPHQLDVFATGAWHMAYNFMDKRLIADGVAFLEDGTKKNSSVYDLFFELGYMHYDKTKIYPKSVEAYRAASTKHTTTGKKIPPSYVRHQLAHAIEKMGDIDQCIRQWEENLRIGREVVAEDKNAPAMGAAGPNVPAARHNLYITKRRLNERLASSAERAKDAAEAKRLWEANLALAEEWLQEFPNHGGVVKDQQRAVNEVERLAAGKLRPQEPADLDLHFSVTRIAPRKLLIEGTIDALDLSRVRVMFRDENYEEIADYTKGHGLDYKMANGTLELENVSVNKNKFKYTLDLDRDPADMGRAPAEIYPLKGKTYTLSVTYNPRLQAAFIQDRYGWNGEGLTAKGDDLKIDESRAGILNGKRYPLRYVEKSTTIQVDDITAKGKKLLYKG